MKNICWIALLILVCSTAACQGRTVSQAYLPTATNPFPVPSSTPTTAPPGSDFLEIFPLAEGTTWTYKRIGYAQAPSDPKTIIEGRSEIVETVVETVSGPDTVVAHIQGRKTLVEADQGWEENDRFGLGDYEYWYAVRDGKVYFSDLPLEPADFQSDLLALEFQFPMGEGTQWCPLLPGEARGSPGTPLPSPCEYSGMRTVEQVAAYTAPAGKFERCYQMRDAFNSGGVIQWFCEGIGIVAKKYDHIGSRFGFTQELIDFSR